MSTSPQGTNTTTSPRSPITPESEGRQRSGSWLGRIGDGRRRSSSVASPQSPSLSRARSPSVSGSKDRQNSLSIDLSTSEGTVPEVLGSLMFSPRADKLEDSFIITDPSEVKNAQLINSSGLSHFYVADYKGKKVLQKIIRYRNIDDRVLASFEKEVAVLSTLHHPNIVTFLGAKATPPDLFMLLEWMARGSLSALLLHDLSVDIAWALRMRWALDVAKGIEYLHSMRPKIIHRDLRADNVMVTEDNTAKLSEFALSRRKRFAMKVSPRNSVEVHHDSPQQPPPPLLSVNNNNNNNKGKEDASVAFNEKYPFVSEGGPAFTAPELLAGKSYSEKVDSFNYGILLWQLMTRQIPHHGRQPVAIAEGVLHEGLRPSLYDFIPEEVKQLIQSCWATEEDKRPSFEHVCQSIAEIQKANLDPDFPTEDVETSASEGSKRDSSDVNEFL